MFYSGRVLNYCDLSQRQLMVWATYDVGYIVSE